jgi:hypothetical protein
MRFFRHAFLLLVACSLAGALAAQSTVPTVGRSIAAQALSVSTGAATFDLRDTFLIPGVSGPVAQFDTVLGKFNVELLSTTRRRVSPIFFHTSPTVRTRARFSTAPSV